MANNKLKRLLVPCAAIVALGVMGIGFGLQWPEPVKAKVAVPYRAAKRSTSPESDERAKRIRDAEAMAAAIGGDGDQSHVSSNPAPTPREPHPASTGLARKAFGAHALGGGWVMQVVAKDALQIEVRCCKDPGWTTADEDPFHAANRTALAQSSFTTQAPRRNGYQFRGRPNMIGAAQQAFADSPTRLEWRIGNEIIHVHVGTDGDDIFHRQSSSTRNLYLSFGGHDRVVEPGPVSVAATDAIRFPYERMVSDIGRCEPVIPNFLDGKGGK